MKKTPQNLLLLASLIGITGAASADIANGLNPYDSGYGFDLPQESIWGAGWIRNGIGTLYAEWDTFAASPDGMAVAPDVGQHGSSAAALGWNVGSGPDAYGNLANATSTLAFYVDVEGAIRPGPVRAVLQFEAWGDGFEYDNILMNGLDPTHIEWTYTDETEIGGSTVLMLHTLAYWDLQEAPATFSFDLSAAAGTSLAQAAVDVAPVPVPAAIWLFGSAFASIGLFNRKKSSYA